MNRKLASVRTVDAITPIPGADFIESVTVDGWHVIASKGRHNVGDRVIYCEIDAALPVHRPGIDPDGTLAARGTKTINDTAHHILKTIKLKGTYSQGMILPLDVLTLPATDRQDTALRNFFRALRTHFTRPGTDVTDRLGIVKYDPFATAAPTSRRKLPADPNLIGQFPAEFARKTDSERIQNLHKHWDKLQNEEWLATEKIDGQSITLINDDGHIRVASRNYELADHPAKQWALDHNFLAVVEPGVAIQGEWAGPGVQTNGLDLHAPRLFAFATWKNGQLTDPHPWASVYAAPPVDRWKDLPEPDALLAHYDGMKSRVNPSRLAEGVVLHQMDGKTYRELGDRSTFKIISNKWLLKQK